MTKQIKSNITIRSYHPSDLCALYRICLQTGDSGKDGSHLFDDPDLLGHYYAAPYAIFDPDVCFVLTQAGAPCGYLLGTRDTQAFDEWLESDWLPILRERYPMPAVDEQTASAKLIHAIHEKPQLNPVLAGYPAHLHIDLLPVAQGNGHGREMMRTFLERLRAYEVPAVHLGVGKHNARAIRFYERVGFHCIEEYPSWIAYGMNLS